MGWVRARMTPERVRFVRFCIVGASGVVVNLGVFTVARALMAALGVLAGARRFVAANAAGFVVSVLPNFLLSDYWTWGDREKRGHAHFWRRLGKFYVVSSAGGAVQIGTAWAVRGFAGVPDHLAVLIGIAVATVVNYVANNVWTFR